MKISEESKAPGTKNGAIFFPLLWCIAIMVFGVGDLLTSSLGFGLGAVEDNPLLGILMSIFGGSIWLLAIVKGIVLSAVFLLSCKVSRVYSWTIPMSLTCAGMYMLIPNIEVLIVLLYPGQA